MMFDANALFIPQQDDTDEAATTLAALACIDGFTERFARAISTAWTRTCTSST
jgi:hypothetical protein